MKLKIFDYLWHIPHQYDMMHALKDDCEFYFCLNIKAQWDSSKRPSPPNLSFVTHYEEGKYDLAILHIDQQVIAPQDRKRTIFDNFNKNVTNIPKIIINHGSPVLTEWFRLKSFDYTDDEIKEICKNEVRSIVGENTMVVNSHTAATELEWGFGTPIVHGMNPDDWHDLPKEPRVFTALSPSGFDRYYNRECLKTVTELLSERYGYTLNHAKVNLKQVNTPEEYKRFLGSSLLYFDPSIRTPMNRARTEAFLSGCCVIQVAGAHDLERWAVDGENIVLVPNDPEYIAETIVDFLENKYHEAIKIGQNAKAMAIKHFSPERYRKDWLHCFEQALALRPTEAASFCEL